MDARLQGRIQRYGWDRAADHYDGLWEAPLAQAHAALLDASGITADQHVLDVACGTGIVTRAAARAVGAGGRVDGIDIADRMVDAATAQSAVASAGQLQFARMDAQALRFEAARFDLVLCALGLMYLPEPPRALAEIYRVLKPGGRVALLVWGERARCAWSAVFELIDAEVNSDVCPLFFDLGRPDALACHCRDAGFIDIEQRRFELPLHHADARAACDAVLVGGPVALAWSRFDLAARKRLRRGYLDAIARWRSEAGYRLPAEFVIVTASRPAGAGRPPPAG